MTPTITSSTTLSKVTEPGKGNLPENIYPDDVVKPDLNDGLSLPTKTPAITPAPGLRKVTELGKGILPEIIYSKDGKRLFLNDGFNLRILNAQDHSQEGILNLSTYGDAEFYGISPDSSMILIDQGMGFSVYDINTQQEIAYVSGGIGPAVWPVFTPDSKYIVYRAAYGRFDWPDENICLLDLTNDVNGIESTDVNNNFYTVMEFGWDKCYRVIHPERVHTMTNPAVSPDGRLVAAGYWDNTNYILYIYDLLTGTVLHEIKEQPSLLNSVAFSPDSSLLASGGNDGLIRLWDPVSGKIKRTINAFKNDINEVQFSTDGRALIVDVQDQPQIIYGLDTGIITEVPAPVPTLDSLSMQMQGEGYLRAGEGSKNRFSPDGNTVAIGDGSLQVWEVASHRMVTALSSEQELNLAGMAYSPDGEHLAVVTQDGSVTSWNIRTGQQEFYVSSSVLLDVQALVAVGGSGLGPGIGAGVFGEKGIAYSPDARRLAIINGPAVEIWDILTASKVLTLAQTQPVTCPQKVSFSEDGEFVYATLNRNRGLAVYDAQTGELVRQLDLPRVDPNAFTATDLKGALFARNNYDETDYWIEIWNIDTGEMLKLPTHQREVEPLRFSTDGNFLTAIFGGNQFFIWRADNGELVLVSEIASDVQDLAISPKGEFLATASYGKITLWDIGIHTSASYEERFVPLAMPPTPTPWNSSSEEVATATPQPTQRVEYLSPPAEQAGAISAQNAAKIRLVGSLGKGRVSRLNWMKDGLTVLAASSLGFYQIDLQTLKPERIFEPDGLRVTSGQTLPDGCWLVAGTTTNGTVQAWDATNETMLVELKGGGEPAISPNGRWLVYETIEGLSTWNLETGQAGTVLLSSYYLFWPVFSPNSQYVAAIQSRSIRVWDVETGVIINASGGPEAAITDMSFSQDGNYLIAAAGGTAWVWNMSPSLAPHKVNLFEGEIQDNLTVFKEKVTSVAMSVDNALLAIGTTEKMCGSISVIRVRWRSI